MKLVLASLCCCLGALGALGALVEPYEPLELNYHERIGIPLADSLRQAELAADFDGSRIISGSQAALGAYPYMAGQIMTLQNGRESIGGGTLISNTRVLTAAHNLFDGRQMVRHVTVVLGSVHIFSGGTRITSNRMELHGSYNTATLHNDIAIITINWVNYSNTIRNIGLASGSNTYAGAWAWAAGFGKTSDVAPASPNLMHVRVQVITNDVCRNTFPGNFVIASTLCISGATGNICTGDSGGPLVANNLLIGVTSFGGGQCDARRPSGFARVSSFNSWIRARM
ncbi:PREDICTED: collagenase-like [Papilio xuthus]|uniref:Collagenase n=1 Tax=Papilio xuthus TaxID=66420 RepID=A0A0N1ICZ9_PAPXU|nr:PREDICTED: collagenase-like [Papilio xuthus]KPJ01122.1 Collagenase [Papilio xuthus]